MRILAILSPTNKWGTKAEYTALRKFLLKDGYQRIAPEVFMRITPTRRSSEKHFRRLDEVAPKTGVVRILRLTEKQYESIYMLTGESDEIVQLFITENHITFMFDQTIVVSRLIDGNYIDTSKMISSDYETKVTVNNKGGKGKIEIEYYSPEEFDRIINLLNTINTDE